MAAASAASALRQMESHLSSGPAGGSRAGRGKGGMDAQEAPSPLVALQQAQEQELALYLQRMQERPVDQYEPLRG